MSRRYKKTPWCGDTKGKTKKRLANHSVRRQLQRDLELVPQRGAYKKLYSSWEICDYGWIFTWKEYWKNALDIDPEADMEAVYRKWCKWYRNK